MTFVKLVVLVILVAVVASILFGIIGFLGGIIWFVVKLAVVIAIAYFVVKWLVSR
jgi:hypothetical protein